MSILVKNVCCTCLSINRKLQPMYKIRDGINLLYMLITLDPEAYKEGFFKDVADLQVCWECAAIILRIKKFRTQACAAQKHLTAIADGRNDVNVKTFSCLTITNHTKPNFCFAYKEVIEENFVDCGALGEIKIESDLKSDTEERTLSVPNSDIDEYFSGDKDNESDSTTTKHGKEKKIQNAVLSQDISGNIKIKTKVNSGGKESMDVIKLSPTKMTGKKQYHMYYETTEINEEEMEVAILKRRSDFKTLNSLWKCESCLVTFKTENDLIIHNIDVHEKKLNHKQCQICLSYVRDLSTHKQTHYRYNCRLCAHIGYTNSDIVLHLNSEHNEILDGVKKMIKEKKLKEKVYTRYDTTFIFPCKECDEWFESAAKRWKHVQRTHREGYECKICGKKCALRSNMRIHELIHTGSLPREPCPICNKMIRTDLKRSHLRIHKDKEIHYCVECDKTFNSKHCYENHIRYSKPHCTVDIFKHKCTICPKQFRAKVELEDHIKFQHKGQAEYKCHVCEKGFATKRCVKRHAKRAHEGIKENPKDKICIHCGKAFREKKTLIEHMLIHSGDRPLSCAVCGRAFRQRAALYTHMRRLHKEQK